MSNVLSIGESLPVLKKRGKSATLPSSKLVDDFADKNNLLLMYSILMYEKAALIYFNNITKEKVSNCTWRHAQLVTISPYVILPFVLWHLVLYVLV